MSSHRSKSRQLVKPIRKAVLCSHALAGISPQASGTFKDVSGARWSAQAVNPPRRFKSPCNLRSETCLPIPRWREDYDGPAANGEHSVEQLTPIHESAKERKNPRWMSAHSSLLARLGGEGGPIDCPKGSGQPCQRQALRELYLATRANRHRRRLDQSWTQQEPATLQHSATHRPHSGALLRCPS